MPHCPAGHASADDEYCDTCGRAMPGTGALAAYDAPAPSDDDREAVGAAGAPAPAAEACVVCGEPRSGRFCEECGHDNDLPAPPAPTTTAAGWTAVVRADRAWFEEVRARDGEDADTLTFPRDYAERRVELAGAQLSIGRRSRSRGTDPDLDLGATDPGVSARHAVLVARGEDGWEVVDLASTNGTTVGDAADPIRPHVAVALADGDRIKLGAWTTITLTAPDGQSR